jgi:hypothetical protein
MLGVSQELEKCPLDGILPLENLQQWNLAFPILIDHKQV